MCAVHTNVGSGVNTIVGRSLDTFVGMATFGDRVRDEREAKGWSYQELADRVSAVTREKCPRVTIEKMETRGATKSKWSSGLAEALGVEHDWLVYGKGPKRAASSIDRRLKMLPPDVSEMLHQQFDVLIDNELEKRSRRPQ